MTFFVYRSKNQYNERGWISWRSTSLKLAAKRRPVQESQLFMTTRALAQFSSVLFTRAISLRAMQSRETLRGLCLRSFSFVLTRERITIVREAIRARPRLAFACQWNILKLCGNIWRRHKRAHTYTRCGKSLPRERHLCNCGDARTLPRDIRFFLPSAWREHFHKLRHKAYSYPVVSLVRREMDTLALITPEWIRERAVS